MQNVSSCVAGYHQETGRAGRDGRPSEIVLYYSGADKFKARSMLVDAVDAAGGSAEASEQYHHNEASLNAMAAFAEDIATCRRVLLMRHFGEIFDAASCQGKSPFVLLDGFGFFRFLCGEPKMPFSLIFQVDEAGGSAVASEQYHHNEASLNAMAAFAVDVATCCPVLLMRHIGEIFDAASCQGKALMFCLTAAECGGCGWRISSGERAVPPQRGFPRRDGGFHGRYCNLPACPPDLPLLGEL
jgi:hypothetical protein